MVLSAPISKNLVRLAIPKSKKFLFFKQTAFKCEFGADFRFFFFDLSESGVKKISSELKFQCRLVKKLGEVVSERILWGLLVF